MKFAAVTATVVLGFATAAQAVTVGTVPEASTWVMLVAGFGLVGFAARRRSALAA